MIGLKTNELFRETYIKTIIMKTYFTNINSFTKDM